MPFSQPFLRQLLLVLALIALGLASGMASQSQAGTILRFDTSLGNIDVRLFDTATPLSTANFMNYVNDDDFDSSFFHRAPRATDKDGNIIGAFVVQGGGFTYIDSTTENVPTDAPVQNEPGISNLKYTLAYAKLEGDPNSATSGFFFNTQDNSSNLDNQNSGFTVFGRIVAGFDVIDAIADLSTLPLGGSTFSEVPVRSNTGTLNDVLVFVNDVNELALPDGDYNFDGTVDAADYTVWRDSLGSTTQVEADGNGNGVVDAADYTIWKDTLGQTTVGTGSLVGANVPEPATATLMLLLAGGAALAMRRR